MVQEELDELVQQDLYRLYQNEYGQYLERAEEKERKKGSKKKDAPTSKKSSKNLLKASKSSKKDPLPPNFLKKYGLDCPQKHSYNINALEDIGWLDQFRESPLPMKMIAPTSLVYHKSRFEEDYIPRIVFIPNKKVMFTIMRHCLGVSQVEDLWFVLDPEKTKELQ